jgi:3-methyl-2-oxobutanoate hydroxymethyltransferase
VLVIYDLLGMNLEFKPKFVKRYMELGKSIPEAIARYKNEIKGGQFPAEQHTFHSEEPLFGPREVVASSPADDDREAEVMDLYGMPVPM